MKITITKDKISIATIIVAALILVASVFVLVFVKDYSVKNISVNGITAEIDKNCATVEIDQAETVNIDVKTKRGVKKQFFYDENLIYEIENSANVPINGKDAEIYIALGNKNKIKKTYTLKIKNRIADCNLNFTLNGVPAEYGEDFLRFTVPYNTTILNLSETSDSPFYSFTFYYDSDCTDPVTDLSSIQMYAPKTTLYVKIFNVSSEDTYKIYAVEIVYGKSSGKEILELSVNGATATETENGFSATCERANLLKLELSLSEYANYEIYYDDNLANKASDDNVIYNTDLSDKFTKLFIKVIAQDGSFKVYPLTVQYALDERNEITLFTVNECTAAIEDNEIAVLLNRCASLNFYAVKNSQRAAIAYYYDKNLTTPITDYENVDISEFTEQVYTIYALVTAENGSERLYTVSVNFAPSEDANLKDLKINNTSVEFADSIGNLSFIGDTENFNIDIQYAKISPYARLEVYRDSDFTLKIEDIRNIKLNASNETLYLKITAENGNFSVWTVNISLISNDNEIKSITVNGQQFIISDTENVLYVESNNVLCIDDIIYNQNADLTLYYDTLQTEPVNDLNDVKINNGIGEIYARVIAENSDVKVFFFKIVIKDAPVAVYPVNVIQLDEWQKNIALENLFYIISNSYNEGQFDYEVFWDNKKQNTDHISVENEDKFYQLKIVISSPYFANVVSTKTIQVVSYTLRNVNSSLKFETYSRKELPKALCVSDILNLDCGSYVLGRDFYLEIVYPDLTGQVVIDVSSEISVMQGNYSVFINTFNGYFESYKVGEFKIERTEKQIPQITADSFIEIAESDSYIEIKQLFTVEGNDYDVIMTHTYCNGIETDKLLCAKGIYVLKLQAYYTNGVVEKEIKIEVSSISDNTNIEIFANGNPLTFNNSQTELQNVDYNASFILTADNYNSRANVEIKLNGAGSEFGELLLQTGINQIEVSVTAENGDMQSYFITVTKNERELPVITANHQTIILKKYQTSINLSDFYSVTLNDYESAEANLFYDGKKIVNNNFEVDNVSQIYPIKIVLNGEFGEIEQTFNLSVLAYKGVDVVFKNINIVKNNENYLFTADDFVDDITFFGYNKTECRSRITLDNKDFTSSTLASGEYLITVSVWKNSVLIKEDFRYFVVSFEENANEINVTLKSSDCVITQKSVKVDVYDYFIIDIGSIDPENIFFRFIDLETQTQSSSLTLKRGNNYFTLQIFSVGWQQLYSKEFCIKCTYLPNCDRIFSKAEIDGDIKAISGNRIILINDLPLQTVNAEFTLNDGFTLKLPTSELNLIHGKNEILFNVEDSDGYEFTATLELYNICQFGYYLNSITYNGLEISEDNTLTVSEEQSFDEDKIKVNFLQNAHLSIVTKTEKKHDKVYDVTFTAYYDDVEIGNKAVRIYFGAAQPRLYDIIAKVSGEKIIYSGINEYCLELIAASDTQEIELECLFNDDKYVLQNGRFENLNYGLNNGKFTVYHDENHEFVYDIKVTLFESNIISSVSYGGELLSKTGNFYVVENAHSINKDIIETQLKDNGVKISSEINEVTFNNQTVGVKIEFTYNFTIIQTEYIAAPSDNTSIICRRYGVELTQLGNNVLSDNITIDLSEYENGYEFFYMIDCVHPLTIIEAEGIKYNDSGYFLDVDLTYLMQNGAGTYTHAIELTVRSVSETVVYKIELQVAIA